MQLIGVRTRGDKIQDTPLAKLGGKGLFIKELEQCLLAEEADIAVHSMKDVTVELPDRLVLAVILEREDPRDALVSVRFRSLDDLPNAARIGTSSLRRQCQLRGIRPDWETKDLRGNVSTRLKRLDEGCFDAIILAVAGLRRLGMTARITQYLEPNVMLPAIGQGAIGIECRATDERTRQLVAPLDHPQTRLRLTAERAFNERLCGGCQVPIAGYAELIDADLLLRGLVGSLNGTETVRGEIRGRHDDAKELGIALAEHLLARGASIILEQLKLGPAGD